MQISNYALSLLVPAYLAAAQGGAESVGQDIGNVIGDVTSGAGDAGAAVRIFTPSVLLLMTIHC